MLKAVAIYDNETKETNELPFEEGDEILITQKDEESGWWTGFLKDDPLCKEGLFPGNYVKIIQNEDESSIGSSSGDEKMDEIQDFNQLQSGDQNEFLNQSSSDLEGSYNDDEENDKNIVSEHTLQKGYIWKTSNNKKIITSINEVVKSGKIKKKAFFLLSSSLSSGIKTRKWSDFVWLSKIYKHQYPNICIPPLLNLQPSGRKGFETIENVRKTTANIFLNKISEHPVLSTSNIFNDFLTTDSLRELNQKKDNAKNKYVDFWKTVKIKCPTPDDYQHQQLAMFRANIQSHSHLLKDLTNQIREVSLNTFSNFHNSFLKLSHLLKKWSLLSFHWGVQPTKKEIKQEKSLTNLICALSHICRKIAYGYKEQSDNELNELLIYTFEYQQYYIQFQTSLDLLEKISKKSSYYQEGQLKMNKSNIQTNKDRKKVIKNSQKASELTKTLNSMTNITIGETEYFRKMRLKETVKIIKNIVESQIQFYEKNEKLFQSIKPYITKNEQVNKYNQK
ncbi:sorting nexin [Anaeramoeba flamelloides]|uniref:Sorting nexin n=1 Tax=Anaeramoeba flamelloides TaxID=1746091 RepID=A0ABQ8YA75_9EUKA|nr:sorting nexin [Anaeramoeba flamelloides]